MLNQFDTTLLDAMTPTQRTAYFTALNDFGVTGLSFTVNGNTVASLSLSETAIMLNVSGMIITLTGDFTNRLGEAADIAYQLSSMIDATGDITDLSLIAEFGSGRHDRKRGQHGGQPWWRQFHHACRRQCRHFDSG